MRETASTFRMPGLFKLAALLAVTFTLLISSGCGKKCCNNRSSCNSCNTCNTCGVSDASTSGCATGNCGVSSSTYSNVGQAPQSLSEPSYSPASVTAPTNAYSNNTSTNTTTTYSGTNTTFDRVGTTQDLPVFGAAPTNTVPPPAPAPYVAPITAPAPAPAQLLPTTQPRSNGGSQYHTLQKGETVYGISRQYGVSPKAVLAANQFQDPNRLSVGTKVLIPAH